jgi:hypothetical protein
LTRWRFVAAQPSRPAPSHWSHPNASCSFDLNLRVEPVWKVKRGLITLFLVERNSSSAKPDASDLKGMDVATMA